MLNSKTVEVEYPLETAKEAFWLAYKAAGGARGMGAFQARGDATREDVFENVQAEGDYPGEPRASGNELYGDYVFGRMLKLRLAVADEGVEVPTTDVRPDYQSWSREYSSYEALVEAAAENVASMDETIDRSLWERIKDAVI